MTSDNKPNNARSSRTVSRPAARLVVPAEASERTLAVGLDILEYLVNCQQSRTASAISQDLNLTSAQVKGSIAVLEHRGYVSRTGDRQSYHPTGKLFDIFAVLPDHDQLLVHARPVMQALSDSVSQSCNIAVPSAAEMQVIAQQDSPGAFGISVPVGYRYEVPNSAAGLTFVAFSETSDPAAWPDTVSSVLHDGQWSSLKNAVRKATEVGFAQVENPLLPDVIDLSCPVVRNNQLIAALTVPYIQTKGSVSQVWCLAALQQAAEQLSRALQENTLVA